MTSSTVFPGSALAAGLLVVLALSAGAPADDLHTSQVAARKKRFLADRIEDWMAAGCPLVQYEGKEWKFDEIEPCWAGAHAAMLLKRTPEEAAKANWFFANAPVDWECDPDMRICELLHSYYAFKDDRDLGAAAKAHLLSVLTSEEAPRRLCKSSWSFRATENHAMMGHVWRLLTSQMRGDESDVAEVSRYITDFILEHARKGWYEYYSPCYVEKEIGCVAMLREWAEDPKLRKLADMMLDLLFAEQAVLTIDGAVGGPCMRAYGTDIVPGEHEINHNNCRDRMRSGQYSAAEIVFGNTAPSNFYGVLGSFCVASSGYVPPDVVSRLGAEREARGCYEFRARKPGRGLAPYRNSDRGLPPDEAFDTRVYCYATPDFILGTSQEVVGRFGMTDARQSSLFNALLVSGSPRKTIYFECGSARQVDLFQHKNVLIGKTDIGAAYVATDEIGQPIEEGGWILLKDPHAYIAIRPARGGWSWRNVTSRYTFGKYLYFEDVTSPFVMEVARPSDYAGGFDVFKADVLDGRLRITDNDGLIYESCSRGESGPSAEAFTVELRPGDLPMVDGKAVDLEGYPTLGSPHLKSAWNSGIVSVAFEGKELTLDFNKAERRMVAAK